MNKLIKSSYTILYSAIPRQRAVVGDYGDYGVTKITTEVPIGYLFSSYGLVTGKKTPLETSAIGTSSPDSR
jgi:hypothetical protein